MLKIAFMSDLTKIIYFTFRLSKKFIIFYGINILVKYLYIFIKVSDITGQ